ncbi:MAG: hypothetical protein LUE89_11855 [Clostridiales bacterium]|nr:hypothetical protein [Clostridiales bacterium]
MCSPATAAEQRDYRTKLQIINRLWGHIFDLLLYIQDNEGKTIDQIQQEIDRTEYYCSPYADCDDDELRALELARTVQQIKMRGKNADA